MSGKPYSPEIYLVLGSIKSVSKHLKKEEKKKKQNRKSAAFQHTWTDPCSKNLAFIVIFWDHSYIFHARSTSQVNQSSQCIA